MTQFQVKNVEKLRGEQPSDIVKSFLSSVDSTELSEEILDQMGWGGGDPIVMAMSRLMELADQW